MTAMTETSRMLADRPCIIGREAYVSADYAREEAEKLWPKVWQVACREEEIPNVGDYVTYEILDESIIVTRIAPDRLAAYYNSCQHRGRKLTEGNGHTKRFACKFHGWKWDLEGQNVEIVREEGWEGAICKADLALKQAKVDTWGGWVWINMDPDAEPLRDYLEPAATMLDPFELEKMRYRWRQWLIFPCNWKVAVEAFNEAYHVVGTHPQLTKYSQKASWSAAMGKHGVFGSAAREGVGGASSGASGAADMREGLKHSLNQIWEEVNATTTQTMVDMANLLEKELPDGTPAGEVQMHLMKRTIEEDARRGVIWPRIDPAHMRDAGNGWHLFPNTEVLQGPTFALCYRARPNGLDPDSCIFEVYTLERFPEGQEPRPENIYKPDINEESWRKVLCQDFSNMGAVQQGMKSRGFTGMRPSPDEERAVTNFHRVLSDYMGRGAPVPMD